MKISGKTLGQSAAFRKLVGALVIYAVIQILLATGLLSDYYFATIVTIGINVILAVSLNLITGFTGQFKSSPIHSAYCLVKPVPLSYTTITRMMLPPLNSHPSGELSGW